MRLRPFDLTRDDAFARALHAETVAVDLAPLPEPLRGTLLAQQYAAWSRALGGYPALEDLVIEHEEQPIGRLLLSCPPATLHVVEIGLVTPERGRGTGSAVLRDVIARAAAEQRTVRATARRDGRAVRIYERLGFTRETEDELHVRFVLVPNVSVRGVDER